MLTFFPLGVVGPWQIVIIALVILLLFGGKKIPELMRGLGKGLEFQGGHERSRKADRRYRQGHEHHGKESGQDREEGRVQQIRRG